MNGGDKGHRQQKAKNKRRRKKKQQKQKRHGTGNADTISTSSSRRYLNVSTPEANGELRPDVEELM
jgi:hypothetical protein